MWAAVSVIFWTIGAIALFKLVKYLYKYLQMTIALRRLPGPPSTNWLYGNISAFFDTPENVFKVAIKWGTEYYPIYHNWIAHRTVANVMNPQDFETILSSSKHITKSPVYEMLHKWLGTGLLTSTDAKWQHRRKILTPAFHFNILQGFVAIFNEETDKLVEELKKNCHKPHIDVTRYLSEVALNSIGETAMGSSFHSLNQKVVDYKNAIYGMGKIFLHRLFRPWLLVKVIYFFDRNYSIENRLVDTLHKFTSEVIEGRKKNFTPVTEEDLDITTYSKRKRLAMLDLLLTNKHEGAIDDKGIREEVDTFMFEGHDTVSVALGYALMLLANNREAQDDIVQEMTQVLGSLTNKPTYQNLQDLKFLERCIKEVLRLYPSVHFIGRQLSEDITCSTGQVLRAGSYMHLNIYVVHRNPDLYPDPEKFDPDRFLPENSRHRHPFAYVPFSAGPRNCIGQRYAILEMKSVICGILSQFVLEPVDTPDSIVLVSDLVLRSRNGIRVKFVPRKN